MKEEVEIGYFRIWRKMFDKPIFDGYPLRVALWLHLLKSAMHSNKKFWFEGKEVTLKPGQILTGRKYISTKTGIKESTVQKNLKLFEREHLIEQQTTRRNRLITIVKWEEYQYKELPKEQQKNNRVTKREQQSSTIKECIKECKKECVKEANPHTSIFDQLKNKKEPATEAEINELFEEQMRIYK